ncbi:hypothetical protein TNCV_833601 [Trichonephila clavipes]|nr:hypothetical protein TNCV_833601 [Trichonephila clavipes]
MIAGAGAEGAYSQKDGVAAVAEWYGYRTVACFVMSSSPVPLKTRHVGQRCTRSEQIQKTPQKTGRDEVPPSTSVLTKQNAGGAKGESAGRKTGRPKAVNQVGDSLPQKPKRRRCCAMKLLVLFRVWKESPCRVMGGAKRVSPLR